MKLIPKNWNEFQQYKDRKPTWIKLHRDLLNNFAYGSVQIGTKATLPLLWLLACEYENGAIEASAQEIAYRIRIDLDIVEVAIQELVEVGFFILEENVQFCTEVYKMVPREEKRRDREETEKRQRREETEKVKNRQVKKDFDLFWKHYPKKKAKAVAERTFNAKYKTFPDIEIIINSLEKNKLSKDWIKDKGQFIPYPSSWLNARRWEDEETEVKSLYEINKEIGDEWIREGEQNVRKESLQIKD